MIDVAFSEQPYLWLAMYNLLYRFNINRTPTSARHAGTGHQPATKSLGGLHV